MLPASLTGTQYQLQKFIKHTTPTRIYPVNGVFNDPSFAAYSGQIVSTIASGWYNVDNHGKHSMAFFVGTGAGVLMSGNVCVGPADTVRVVLHQHSQHVHAYPAPWGDVEVATCDKCGTGVPC